MKAFLIAAVFLSLHAETSVSWADSPPNYYQPIGDSTSRLIENQAQSCAGLYEKYEAILQAQSVCQNEDLFVPIKSSSSSKTNTSKYKTSLENCKKHLESCANNNVFTKSNACLNVRYASKYKELTELEKTQREKMEAAQSKKLEADSALLTATSDWKDQVNRVDEALSKLKEERDQVLPDFQREIAEGNYSKRQQVESLKSAMQDLIAEKKNLVENTRLLILNEINDQKFQIKAECWQRATEKVTAELERERAQAATGTLSYGSLGELFDRAQTDRIDDINNRVNQYYQLCLNDGRLAKLDQDKEVRLATEIKSEVTKIDAQLRGLEGQIAGAADFGTNVAARDNAVAKLKTVSQKILQIEGRREDINSQGLMKMEQSRQRVNETTGEYQRLKLTYEDTNSQYLIAKSNYLTRGAPNLENAQEKLKEAQKLVADGYAAFARYYGRPIKTTGPDGKALPANEVERVTSADGVQELVLACTDKVSGSSAAAIQKALEKDANGAEQSKPDEKWSTIDNLCDKDKKGRETYAGDIRKSLEQINNVCQKFRSSGSTSAAAAQAYKDLGLTGLGSEGQAPSTPATPPASPAAPPAAK